MRGPEWDRAYPDPPVGVVANAHRSGTSGEVVDPARGLTNFDIVLRLSVWHS
jgi:hypothetical protein